MESIEWLRFVPFLLAGLLLLGWSLIVILQTRREDYDLLNVALAGTGLLVALYLVSVAFTRSGVDITIPLPRELDERIDGYIYGVSVANVYYDVLRVAIGVVSLIGLGPTYINVYRAARERRNQRTTIHEVHDVPKNGRHPP